MLPAPTAADANGVAARKFKLQQLRARLTSPGSATTSRSPRAEELEAAHHHAEDELAQTVHGHQNLPAGDYSGPHELDGHPADGHQFDGRHPVEGEELRKGH